MAAFPPDFDQGALEGAWSSGNPVDLNNVNALQGGFENVLNQLLESALEVCRLEGWFGGDDQSMLLALRRLRDNGVITEPTRKALADAKELRDGTQHAYPDIAASDFHTAVSLLLESGGDYIQDVSRWMAANHP